MIQDDKRRTIPIVDIVADPTFQIRKKLDAGKIREYSTVYRSEEHSMPPIEVAEVDGVLFLTDGWHRLEAQKRLVGLWGKVEAVVEAMNISEAKWRAASGNLKHGLPLKSNELRSVFRTYIKTKRFKSTKGKLKSYREIATELGGKVAHTTLRNWMKKDFPKLFSRYSGESSGALLEGNKEVPLDERLRETANEALSVLLTAYNGIKDEREKGDLVELAEMVLREMKASSYEINSDF
jgi:hypothetical protein